MFQYLSNNWLRLRPYFILVLIGLALYGRVVFFDFSYLDDNVLVVDHYPIISDVRNIGFIFSNDVFFSLDKNYYRPLLNLSLMLDAAVGGTNPAIFHFINLLLHLVVTGLIFAIFKKMGRSASLSFFLALLFLVHPANSQAVAWIPGRNDLLLAVFSLGAWLSFLSWQDKQRLRYYLSYLGLFSLALLTKETAIILPAMLLIYSLLLKRDNWRRPDFWLFIIGSGAISGLWLMMRRLALGLSSTDLGAVILSFWQNIEATLLYIGKLVLPFNLGVFPILVDVSLVYGLASLLMISLALYFSVKRQWSLVIFGSLWFLLFLWPSFIRPVGLADFLEHRMYLPFFGFLVVIAEIDWVNQIDWRKKRATIVAVIILTSLAAISFYHIGDFKDRLTFWQAAAKSSPHSPLVQRNLGVMYFFEGKYDQAVYHYQTALELNNQEEMVHNNLGVIYLEQNKIDEAILEFKRELVVNPNYDKALLNLGEAHYKLGQEEEALRFWQAALVANPNNLEARRRLLIKENQIQ